MSKETILLHFGTILLYVAVFGFSNYFVEKYKLEKIRLLIYYFLVLLIGFGMVIPSLIR